MLASTAIARLPKAAPPESENGYLKKLVVSNIGSFVNLQQYFFDMLWDKAIPANQRIKGIIEGREADRLEVIQDTQRSIGRAFEIMNDTKKEFLVLFANTKAFILAMSMEAADLYRKMLVRGATVRVLVPTGQGVQDAMKKVKAIAPGIDFRISDAQLNTRITMLVSDRTYFMAWQLRDDSLNDPYQAGGVATYSNMVSLAESYATIFDNLWNITEFAENLRLANAKLEEKEKAMKDFIDTAAHELRTPIQPILGLAESLRDMLPEPTSEQDRLLQVIIRNAKRLKQLQEDILDVTRIDGGLLRIRKEKTNLNHVLRDVVADYKSQPNLVGLELTCTCEPDLTLAVDRQRIIQVLTNLIGNAIKFSAGKSTPDGRVRHQAISVQAKSVNNVVVMQVRDSGSGIDKDILPRLFTKFATKSDSGTGLGLYIAKGIIEAHGGKIWAENNIGGPGATFSISLPAENLT